MFSYKRRFSFDVMQLPGVIDFYVSTKEGKLYVSGPTAVKTINLFNYVYFKNDRKVFLKFFVWKQFKSVSIAIRTMCCNFFFGFFFELTLYGSGFEVLSVFNVDFQNFQEGIFEIYVGLNHSTYVFFKSFNQLRSNLVFARGQGRKILFFSKEKGILYDIVVCMLLVRKIDPYKLTGIVYPQQMLLVKVGKKRLL